MNLQEINVLILDDSSVILSSVSRMLSRMGVREENIYFSQDPKVGVTLSKRIAFDVLLCDFNFGPQINGKQVLEELIHYQCLLDRCAFIMITADSSTQTFNSIFEITLDDYLLKPFNYNCFKKRVVRCLKKRKDLEPLYRLKRLGRYSEALEICEQGLRNDSQYSGFFKREKGHFLRLLKRWGKAQRFYTELHFSEPADWVTLGLVNALKNNGELRKARILVQTLLEDQPHHIDAMKEISSIEVAEGNITASIGHLVDINKITRDNSERNLIISNLCLYIDDFYQAKLYYAKYREANKDTYRENRWLDVNYLRRALMYLSFEEDDAEVHRCQELFAYLHQAKSLSTACRLNVDILMSHFLFIKGEYKEAGSLLNQAFHRVMALDNIVFYDLLYLYWLLIYLSYDSTYQGISNRMQGVFMQTIKGKSAKHHSDLLIDSLELLHEKSHQYYLNKQRALSDANMTMKLPNKVTLLTNLISLAHTYPTLLSLRVEILKLLNVTWPQGYGRHQVESIVEQSNRVIRAFSSDEALQNIEYEGIYSEAKKRIVEQHFVTEEQ
ncbi:response regulator [Vibrio chagasii]|uniref:response regulator n=1 Tax=Vibrio chagasii TaxID=170679 RepID=UPI002283CB31|nr:response regulator [Vibrio chagasii]MCY9826476.1 response regulator [Vibrio chagasii]